MIKAQYDKYIYPIIAPPAIAIVKLMTRFVHWMIDNMDVLIAEISKAPDNKILQKEFKMVLVTWQDTEQKGGWHDKLELLDYVIQECVTMKSAGWLIYNSYVHIVIAMTCSDDHTGELLKIPWAMISDMRTVPDDKGDVYRFPNPECLRQQKAKEMRI